VRLTIHVVEVCDGSSDLTGVRVALCVSADMVISAGEEGHGDRVDLGHIDQVGFMVTVIPRGIKLLEAIQESVLGPVLLSHDRRALIAAHCRSRLANDFSERVTGVLKVSGPVWAIDGVDAIFLEMCESFVVVQLHDVGCS